MAILEEIITERIVLLSNPKTPTRLGLQAFRPLRVEGSAVQLHPLLCTAFQVGFDGDLPTVHAPQTSRAQDKSHALMPPMSNLQSPGSGDLRLDLPQDVAIGLFEMTCGRAAGA